jgi:mannose-1-phosphate guanylyltransferase
MAWVAGRPFLELLLEQLRRTGFSRVILAVGYGQDTIHSHFGDRALDLEVVYSPGSSPLGTGGALRNAAELVRSDDVVVMNGDSFTEAPLSELVYDHRESEADVSIMVSMANGRADCGIVLVDAESRVVAFEEKRNKAEGAYVNAGIYVFSPGALFDIPSGREVSLEKELFPRWLAQNFSIRAFTCDNPCLDIRTPERFCSAQALLNKAADERTAGRRGHG